MFEAVRASGKPCALVLFPGEQHGFRAAAVLRRALDGELDFFARCFRLGAPLPEDYERVEVANMPRGQ